MPRISSNPLRKYNERISRTIRDRLSRLPALRDPRRNRATPRQKVKENQNRRKRRRRGIPTNRKSEYLSYSFFFLSFFFLLSLPPCPVLSSSFRDEEASRPLRRDMHDACATTDLKSSIRFNRIEIRETNLEILTSVKISRAMIMPQANYGKSVNCLINFLLTFLLPLPLALFFSSRNTTHAHTCYSFFFSLQTCFGVCPVLQGYSGRDKRTKSKCEFWRSLQDRGFDVGCVGHRAQERECFVFRSRLNTSGVGYVTRSPTFLPLCVGLQKED